RDAEARAVEDGDAVEARLCQPGRTEVGGRARPGQAELARGDPGRDVVLQVSEELPPGCPPRACGPGVVAREGVLPGRREVLEPARDLRREIPEPCQRAAQGVR